MVWLFVFVLLTGFLVTPGHVKCEQFASNLLYWDLDPYIVTRPDGKSVKGIVSEIMNKGEYYCGYHFAPRNLSFAQYVKIAESREEFLGLLFSNKSNKEIIPENIPEENVMWGPLIIDRFDVSYLDMEFRRGLRPYPFSTTEHLAVIVQRSRIELISKVSLGVQKCGELILISVLFACCVSILLWLLEFRSNQEISGTFLDGYGNSIWCAFVSMATVGYGDVAPKTIFGRLVMIAWVTVGLVLAGVLTATVSNTLSEPLDIRGQTISVLNNSVSERVAAKDLSGTLLVSNSYDDVLENVRNGKAYAALLNSDVAAARQRVFRDNSQQVPLRVISLVEAQSVQYFYGSTDEDSLLMYAFVCMSHNAHEITEVTSLLLKRHCKIDVIYKPNLLESMQKPLLPILIGISVFLLLCCGVYEYYLRQFGKNKVGNKYLVAEQTAEEIVHEECLKMKRMLRNQNSGEKLGESVFYIAR